MEKICRIGCSLNARKNTCCTLVGKIVPNAVFVKPSFKGYRPLLAQMPYEKKNADLGVDRVCFEKCAICPKTTFPETVLNPSWHLSCRQGPTESELIGLVPNGLSTSIDQGEPISLMYCKLNSQIMQPYGKTKFWPRPIQSRMVSRWSNTLVPKSEMLSFGQKWAFVVYQPRTSNTGAQQTHSATLLKTACLLGSLILYVHHAAHHPNNEVDMVQNIVLETNINRSPSKNENWKQTNNPPRMAEEILQQFQKSMIVRNTPTPPISMLKTATVMKCKWCAKKKLSM